MADRHALARHANNRKIWRNLWDRFPHPYSEADAVQYIESLSAPAMRQGNWAVEVRGEAVGALSIVPHGDIEKLTAEIGYWLGEALWGKGIATAAVRAASEAAFATTDLVRLHAPVFAWNQPSMRVLEKAGYVREATLRRAGFKDGIVIDRVVFALIRETGLPYEPAPARVNPN
jgi:RimJ/RimL family protein N-acetyltransferase